MSIHPLKKGKILYHASKVFFETYQDNISSVDAIVSFVVDVASLDFLDDVGLASIYARGALSNSSFSSFMRPPRAGMHTKRSASTSEYERHEFQKY